MHKSGWRWLMISLMFSKVMMKTDSKKVHASDATLQTADPCMQHSPTDSWQNRSQHAVHDAEAVFLHCLCCVLQKKLRDCHDVNMTVACQLFASKSVVFVVSSPQFVSQNTMSIDF